MSGHVFVKRLLLIDGDIIWDSENDTVLVELVDEKGNCSEGYVPTASLNLEIKLPANSKPGIFDVNSPISAAGSSKKSQNVNKKEHLEKSRSTLYEDDPSTLHSTEEVDNDSFSNNEKTASDATSRFNWSTGPSKRLLNLYNEYFPKVKPMSAMQNKKQMFEKIATVLNEEFHIDVDGTQCANHHKSIVRKYKADERINRTSGESRVDLEFEEEIAEMKAADDSLEPEVRMGIGRYEHVAKKRKIEKEAEEVEKGQERNGATGVTEGSSKTSMNASNGKPASVAETLMLITERKEEKRDRRFQQKLDLLRAIFKPDTDK